MPLRCGKRSIPAFSSRANTRSSPASGSGGTNKRNISSTQLWVILLLMIAATRPHSLSAFLAFVLLFSFATLAEAKPPRWEYLVVSAGLKNQPLQQMLNNQGAQGWELVAFTPGSVAVFKRPKSK